MTSIEEGIANLVARLEAMDARLQAEIYPKLVRAGAAPVLAALQSESPVESGTLKASMVTRVQGYGQSAMSATGVRTRFGRPHNGKFRRPSKYIHLVARGTTHSRANPFMEVAAALSQDAALGAMLAIAESELSGGPK